MSKRTVRNWAEIKWEIKGSTIDRTRIGKGIFTKTVEISHQFIKVVGWIEKTQLKIGQIVVLDDKLQQGNENWTVIRASQNKTVVIRNLWTLITSKSQCKGNYITSNQNYITLNDVKKHVQTLIRGPISKGKFNNQLKKVLRT